MQYLYLIKSGEDYYKIGIANDPKERMLQLQTGNPLPLAILACYEFENAQIVERAIHQAFSATRVSGEWFKMTNEQSDVFHNLCRLLGGVINNSFVGALSDYEIDNNEDEIVDESKFNYRAMFLDGWSMNVCNRGDDKNIYWCWRKRSKESKGYIYGGKIGDLPYPIEEMRKVFGDNNEEE